MASAFPSSSSSAASSSSTSSARNSAGQHEDGDREPQGSPGPSILDHSYAGMESHDLAEALANQPSKVHSSVETILATNNSLLTIPDSVVRYRNLRLLDLSNNQLTEFPDCITQCVNLKTISARNNLLEESSFPKNLHHLVRLNELHLSGNLLSRFPVEVLEVTSLQILHLGGNRISTVPKGIRSLKQLEVLYLGGNLINDLPFEIGELNQLKVFVLCDNRLESLPTSVSNLKQLKSLLLHRNRITALPVELIKLRNLLELSLRDNPLVNKFVRQMVYNPPSLMELSARTVKLKKIPFSTNELPENLFEYLTCAHQCVNPRCKGVYFDTRVEHIKFVDFCGKYRIPLLQYLCSPKCSDTQSPAYEVSDSDSEDERIRRVLLG
ncbi:unnamed protein product [Orchesella dallaii]|uniref:Leucine-rich repeat-containing protein 58 n=1 Tax=Orchesella dallaii TaxID=48710 RepID=A0ABP1QR00_9HEXA